MCCKGKRDGSTVNKSHSGGSSDTASQSVKAVAHVTHSGYNKRLCKKFKS